MMATLCFGLRDSSRIKIALSGIPISIETMFQSLIYDRLNWLCWSRSKSAHDHGEPPASFTEKLIGKQKEEFESFETPENFEEYWQNKTGHKHKSEGH